MKKRDDIYLSQISEQIRQIKKHLKGISRQKFLKSAIHKSAVVRELEVIGEAARSVSEDTKKRFPGIPWAQMVGMRNRLIHGYFDVDYDIVWSVANEEMPRLEGAIQDTILATSPPIHPWRNCPLGYYFVRPHPREVAPSPENPDGTTNVREHCRRNPSGKDQLYPKEIKWVVENLKDAPLMGKIGRLGPLPKNANDFDRLILLWTRYWNEVFSPKEPLDPDVIKALFFTESSFDPKVDDQKISSRNYARGPLQISDETRKVMADEKGELKEHYLTLDKNDVKDPEIALAAATRWLFHKKELAGKYLKRDASWEEAIADYKGYLRLKGDFRDRRGMKKYHEVMGKLKGVEK